MIHLVILGVLNSEDDRVDDVLRVSWNFHLPGMTDGTAIYVCIFIWRSPGLKNISFFQGVVAWQISLF